MKLPEKYLAKFRKAGARGGRKGSRRDKVRAALKSVEARAKKVLKLTYDGNSLSVSRWSKITGIPTSTIWARIRKNLPTKEILYPTTNKRKHHDTTNHH